MIDEGKERREQLIMMNGVLVVLILSYLSTLISHQAAAAAAAHMMMVNVKVPQTCNVSSSSPAASLGMVGEYCEAATTVINNNNKEQQLHLHMDLEENYNPRRDLLQSSNYISPATLLKDKAVCSKGPGGSYRNCAAFASIDLRNTHPCDGIYLCRNN